MINPVLDLRAQVAAEHGGTPYADLHLIARLTGNKSLLGNLKALSQEIRAEKKEQKHGRTK